MCQGSGPGEPSSIKGAGGKSGKPRKKDPTVIATKEAVGRQVAVWSDDIMEWSKATIAQYNPDNFQHLVRFNEREQGSVKHEEMWVNLAKTRFQWLTQPSPTAPPNPTYQGAPKGDEAVGYQVRVFWPGMAKWYQGKIEAYDPETKQHTVKYRDGDIKTYKLRHEAVVYLDKSNTPARKDRSRGSSKDKDEEKKKVSKKDKDGKNAVAGVKRPRKDMVDSSADDDHQSKKNSKLAGKKKSATGHKKKKGTSASPSPDADDDNADDEEEDSEDDSDVGSDDDEEEEEEEEDVDEATDSEDEPLRGPKKKHGPGSHAASKATARGAPPKQRKNQGHAPSSAKARKNIANAAGGAAGAVPVLLPQQPLEGAPRRRGRPPGSGTGRKNNVRGGGRLGSGPGRKDFPVPRMMRAEEEIIRSAGAAVVNARVAVFYNDEDAFYKGKLIQFDSYHKRHKVVYDDGEEEWIALPRENFRYLTPRTRSAGCNATFRKAMSQLGAAQEVGAPLHRGTDASVIQGTTAPVGEVAPAPPAVEESAGWEVSIRSAADGRWHRGEILCYDSHRSMHYVLYIDGEDEWVCVPEEEVVWHRNLPAGRQGLFPGKSPGVAEPAGRDAVGWRVSVFWPGDTAFYPGEVAGWDESTGRYEVSYDDGEEGTMKISEDRIKWILPPGVAVDHENLERMEVGGGRPRRRVTAAGGDSDPDYEFENAAGGAYHLSGGPGSRGGRRGGGGYRGGGRLGRPSAAALAAMHGWGDSLGGDASDALPSPMHHGSGGYHHHQHQQQQHHYNQQHRRGGGHHHASAMPMPYGHFSQHAAAMGGPPATGPETFIGDPVVHRTLTRVAAFGCPSNGAEVSLPNAITVKIYLSGGVDGGKGTAAAIATPSGAATVDGESAEKNDAGNKGSAEKEEDGGKKEQQQDQQPSSNGGGASGAPTPPPSAATVSDCPGGATAADAATPNVSATVVAKEQQKQQKQGPLPPAEKLQARLQALDLMARRVGRAQQSIVKGVPTDLPTHVIRPLRLGPPPSVARLVAAGTPGVVAPARTPGSAGTQNGGTPHGGTHRLGRPSGVSHSPFHRRRSLDEEDDSEEEEDDDEDEDGGNRSSDDDGADGSGSGDDQEGNHIQSSSGSSDDEGGDPRSDNNENDEEIDEEEDEVVVSPRSPTLPRGGKVKPSGGSGDFGATLGVDKGGNHHGDGGSPMVAGLGPVVPPSPFMPQPPSSIPVAAAGANGNGNGAGPTTTTNSAAANNAAAVAGTARLAVGLQHASLDLKDLSAIQGDLPASDSVANLLNIPRNQSAMLLGDMPSASGCPSENGDFMDLN